MPNKNRINTKSISIDEFLNNPNKNITFKNIETLEILKHNLPVMYIITPSLYKRLLAIQTIYNEINNHTTISSMVKNTTIKNIKKKEIQHSGKFCMFHSWSPDSDFLKKASLWGIILKKQPTKTELASFISYWIAEGKFYHQIQWQQKLARSLYHNRVLKNYKKNRDINELPDPDEITPKGFRGK